MFRAATAGKSRGSIRRRAATEDDAAAAAPIKSVAVQLEDVHNAYESADALGLAGFDPDEPRDERGRWTRDGSSAASSEATRARRTPRGKRGGRTVRGRRARTGRPETTLTAAPYRKNFVAVSGGEARVGRALGRLQRRIR
jgi:hypothetical protein